MLGNKGLKIYELSFNVCKKLKFGKICRKNLLCMKMYKKNRNWEFDDSNWIV